MALKTVLNTPMDTPYFKLPPITVKVLKLEDQSKVVSWDFGATVKAATIKNNKVAILSDGSSVIKVTIYEEYASKITEGGTYVIRGYTLRGQFPPYFMNIAKNTMFFRGTTLQVPQNLLEEAEALLHPASPLTLIKDCTEGQGYMSVQGEIIEMFAVKRVRSGKEFVPTRRLTLEQESNRISITLWREAAMAAANIGELVIISHLKATRTDYGIQLQSSQLTKIEKPKLQTIYGEIIGVMDLECSGCSGGSSGGGSASASGSASGSGSGGSACEVQLQVLLESGEVFSIEKATWEPFEAKLKLDTIRVK
ncbi:uncharacterized protein LOC117537009 [Gymnodraco acuticeps]|uniref:Uncharacterized protein LOC117537009 n=1 Tax=Gymnodraco acuticeps TaxID=8218 RepID=A0A6P8T3E9_GYMAC|nr:uncharacterized protein LOC117537009 [Gymnodraco acuticeps]